MAISAKTIIVATIASFIALALLSPIRNFVAVAISNGTSATSDDLVGTNKTIIDLFTTFYILAIVAIPVGMVIAAFAGRGG